MKYILPILVAVIFLPDIAQAQQGLTEGLCDGTTCSACHFVELANRLIKWLIGVVVMLFAVLAVWAGFGLVTSGGNLSALQDAKGRFTNAFIGFIIVLAAWLIVDTLMRGIVSGTEGEIDGYGPWSQIQCGTQSEVGITPGSLDITLDEGDGSNTSDTLLALTPNQLAALGEGVDGIVDFAELMDAKNCSYSQPKRNGCRGTPAYTDCSDLVNIAYQAAGCRSPGTYTGNMISNARPFSSASELRAGDALIHRTGGKGHVVICKNDGCGTVIHAKGTRYGIVEGPGSAYYNDPRYTSAVRASDFCN